MPTRRAMMRGSVTLLITATLAVLGVASPAQAATLLAQDGFGRTVAASWGRADSGGAWTISGTASRFSVDGAAGLMATSPKVTSNAYLSGLSVRDVDAAATFTLSTLPVGGVDYAQLVLRRAGTADYSAVLTTSATGVLGLAVLSGTTRIGNGKSTGITAPAGTPIRVRAEVVGASPTTIRVRAWRASDVEPSTWALTVSDSTAGPQSAGAVGIRTYRTSATTNDGRTAVDDYQATDLATAPVDTPPTASFTATPSGLAVAVDGTASTDADGAIASYRWNFGDGASATGATASHTYSTAGTYSILLTVADTAGVTSSTTRSVVVTGRPSQTQWLADVAASVAGAEGVLDAGATAAARPAIVLDIDNTALQSYYQPHAATPAILALEQRAISEGYTVFVATGRTKDAGSTAKELANAGYRIADLCFRDPAVSLQASKAACRAGWAAQGYTVVANFGNHTSDLDGANSGRPYLLPNYGFLD